MTQHDAVDEDFDWDDDERDYWQEYKDDLAMGYIDEDGNQLDPPDPDPTCYACYDTGLYPYGTDHPCPECGPSRLRRAWWWITDPIRRRWREHRMRKRIRAINPDEPPF